MNTQNCPSESLEQLLSADTDNPNYAAVVEHLDHCNVCQDELGDLAAGAGWWDETRAILSESTQSFIPDLPDSSTVVAAAVTSGVSDFVDVATMLAPPRHPEMLGRIGKYDVEREIGRGGMGLVLKGFDTELNRPVAIKVLAPHLASSGTARQRFVREARAAAAVVHDNVVAIHGIETTESLPAIVMPLISGTSIQEHVENHGPLDPVDVVRIGMQVASGLSAAHAQGLVHRDIKPGNILLENDLNRVQITDFGLARAAHDANLTHSGVIAGTPHFMSPEQALGDRIDHRSDLFSLGSVLYFMATGQLPFTATTPMGVLQRVCNATPQPVREADPAIPEQLELIIEKLLEKSPDHRFDTATDLYQYLADYLAHLQQPTARKAPPRLMTVAGRARRRSMLVRIVALLSGVAGCALLMFASAHYNSGSSNDESSTKQDAPATTLAELNVVPGGQIDAEIANISQVVMALERTAATGQPADGAQAAAHQVTNLETPRSAGQASVFNNEVQSIDAALHQLERTAPDRSFFRNQ